MNSPGWPRVLVSVSSGHGSTTEIARVIGSALASGHLAVDVVPPEDVDSLDSYDAVVLGSAVYTGRWLAPARDFAVRFREPLATRAVWLFSSGPVGDPARKLVQSMEQEPADVTRIRQDIPVRGSRMFAGKLDPQALGLMQRASLLLFRGMRGDFRDWADVAHWADGIGAELAGLPRPGPGQPGQA